jgi:phage terminase Nu1 subunit (DNA packaging protein)
VEQHVEQQFGDAKYLEGLTGIQADTWRYWGWAKQGPPSLKIRGRRIWRLSTVHQWLAEQEAKEAEASA